MTESLTPELDMTRAALDAYSEVRADVPGTFTNGHHRKAIEAALRAAHRVDPLRLALLRVVEAAMESEEGDFGPEIIKLVGPRLYADLVEQLQADQQDLDRLKIRELITTKRRDLLLLVAREAPLCRGSICPKRRVNASSAAFLVREGFLTKHTFPVEGYRLTDLGKKTLQG